MPSADFLRFTDASPHQLLLEAIHLLCRSPRKTSPGKFDNLRSMQPPHIPDRVRVVLDFAVRGWLIRPYLAYHAISVRQLGVLHPDFLQTLPHSNALVLS